MQVRKNSEGKRSTYSAVLQSASEFSSADVESLHALWYFVDRLVFVGSWKVCHHLERNHLNVQFAGILSDEFLLSVSEVTENASELT